MKPTRRTFTILIAAFLLWAFGNQTQVGWLYVMSALLAGFVGAAAVLNRAVLKKLSGDRRIGTGDEEEWYEGNEAKIRLTVRNERAGAAAQIRLRERCPLAGPEDDRREVRLFVPSIKGQGAVNFEYAVEIYRRGLHRFPPVEMQSRAPFGYFGSSGELSVPTAVLVYPEIRELDRLALLDKRRAPEVVRARAGVGLEVLGVREYRTGDSPRHIHWRSVAKTGTLISKEFAEERQPGVTLALDLFEHPYTEAATKHTPFEWAVKVAASVGDYALLRGYPLHIMADAPNLPAPHGAITRRALLEYLARVEPDGDQRINVILAGGHVQQFVAAVLPWPDETALETLIGLHNQGVSVMAALLDPATFPEVPDRRVDAAGMATVLAANGVEAHVIGYGDEWPEMLGAG